MRDVCVSGLMRYFGNGDGIVVQQWNGHVETHLFNDSRIRRRFALEIALKQADAGVAVKDLCRLHEVSVATFYQWRSKYGGMNASDLKLMK